MEARCTACRTLGCTIYGSVPVSGLWPEAELSTLFDSQAHRLRMNADKTRVDKVLYCPAVARSVESIAGLSSWREARSGHEDSSSTY
jgi:hypothetical protein